MMKQTGPDVFGFDETVVRITSDDVGLLKSKLRESSRGRVRICAHSDGTNRLHEMIIALAATTYVRPHKHFDKSESFHIIEGSVDVILFDDAGEITDIVELGEFGSGRSFYYRLSTATYHTLIIHSDPLVIHETTNGPFRKGDAQFAEWAPDESDVVAAQQFMNSLKERAKEFRNRSKS